MNFFLKMIFAAIPLFGLANFSRALELGDRLPNVEAWNQDNKKINLREGNEEGYTLIYFYPKADTPGCTAQACDLRDEMGNLQKEGVKVVGVSGDRVVSQKKFQSKYQLPFDLLADDKGEVMKEFGVKRFPILGLAQRQSFLFYKGRLVWMTREASTKTHAQDVLKAVAQLKLENP